MPEREIAEAKFKALYSSEVFNMSLFNSSTSIFAINVLANGTIEFIQNVNLNYVAWLPTQLIIVVFLNSKWIYEISLINILKIKIKITRSRKKIK